MGYYGIPALNNLNANMVSLQRAANTLTYTERDVTRAAASTANLANQYTVDSNQYKVAALNSDTGLVAAQERNMAAHGYDAGSYQRGGASRTVPIYNEFMDAIAHATASHQPQDIDRALEIGRAMQLQGSTRIQLRGNFDAGVNGKEVKGTFNGADNYDSPEAAVAELSKYAAKQMHLSPNQALSAQDVGLHTNAVQMGPIAPAPQHAAAATPAAPVATTPSAPASGPIVELPPQQAPATFIPVTVPAPVVAAVPQAPTKPAAEAAHPAHANAPDPEPIAAQGKPTVAPAQAETPVASADQTALNKQAQVYLEQLHHSTGAKNHNAASHQHTDTASMDGKVGDKTIAALKAEGIDATQPITQETLNKLKADVVAASTPQASTASAVPVQNSTAEGLAHYRQQQHATAMSQAPDAPAAPAPAPKPAVSELFSANSFGSTEIPGLAAPTVNELARQAVQNASVNYAPSHDNPNASLPNVAQASGKAQGGRFA